MAGEKVQELRNNILLELMEAKKDILGKMKSKLEESFSVIPIGARKLPLICLADGLKRNYNGRSIMVRKGKHAMDDQECLSSNENVKKRLSVMLQVEDQSFVFDGDGLKMVGGIGSEYKGMVDEINNILKKHIKK